MQPLHEAQRRRGRAGAGIEPRHSQLARLNRGLVARDEREEEDDNSQPECAFRYCEQLAGKIGRGEKSQRAESRPAGNEGAKQARLRLQGPDHERETHLHQHEPHDYQQQDVEGENPSQGILNTVIGPPARCHVRNGGVDHMPDDEGETVALLSVDDKRATSIEGIEVPATRR